MGSALPSLQVNDSCLLPNMPDMSLSQSYAQKGEISPGLPCRTTPEPQEEVTTNAASLPLLFQDASQCQPRPISGATRAANNKFERHYQPAKSSKKRHPGGAGA